MVSVCVTYLDGLVKHSFYLTVLIFCTLCVDVFIRWAVFVGGGSLQTNENKKGNELDAAEYLRPEGKRRRYPCLEIITSLPQPTISAGKRPRV